MERSPVQRHGRAGIRVELAPLARAVVREEPQPPLVDALEQHDPHRRHAVGRGGGERHRVGLEEPGGHRLVVPGANAVERFRGQSIAIATYLISRYSWIPSEPPSRPKPDALTPPNGAAGLETSPWLRPIMPVSSPSQTRNARLMSDV